MRAPGLWAAAALCFAAPAHAQSISADDFLASLNGYLTKQWGMIPVGLSGDASFIKVGALYSYAQPRDYCRLLTLAGGERKVDLSPFDDRALPGLPPARVSQVQRYTVQETLAEHLAADLKAQARKAGADAAMLRDRLRSASISFTITRYFIPARPLITSLQRYDAGPLDPSMRGVVAVAQVLVLRDFRFDSAGARRTSGGLQLGFLDVLKGKLSAASGKSAARTMSFPTETVVAFRPIAVSPRLTRPC